MPYIFDQIFKFIFPENKPKFKIGDVVFLYPNQRSSQKTKAIIKIYGKNGFIVCDGNAYSTSNNKIGLRLISRQYIKKFSRKDMKIKKKIWVGWIPIEEVSWRKKEKPKYFE